MGANATEAGRQSAGTCEISTNDWWWTGNIGAPGAVVVALKPGTQSFRPAKICQFSGQEAVAQRAKYPFFRDGEMVLVRFSGLTDVEAVSIKDVRIPEESYEETEGANRSMPAQRRRGANVVDLTEVEDGLHAPSAKSIEVFSDSESRTRRYEASVRTGAESGLNEPLNRKTKERLHSVKPVIEKPKWRQKWGFTPTLGPNSQFSPTDSTDQKDAPNGLVSSHGTRYPHPRSPSQVWSSSGPVLPTVQDPATIQSIAKSSGVRKMMYIKKRRRKTLKRKHVFENIRIPRKTDSTWRTDGCVEEDSFWESTSSSAEAEEVTDLGSNREENVRSHRRKRRPRRLNFGPAHTGRSKPVFSEALSGSLSNANLGGFVPNSLDINIWSTSKDEVKIFNCGCGNQILLAGSIKCGVCGLWTHRVCSRLNDSEIKLLASPRQSHRFCCATCIEGAVLSAEECKLWQWIVSQEAVPQSPFEFIQEATFPGKATFEDRIRLRDWAEELKEAYAVRVCRPKRYKRCLGAKDIAERAASVECLLQGSYPVAFKLGKLGTPYLARFLQ